MNRPTLFPPALRVFAGFATVLGDDASLQSLSTYEISDGALATVRENFTIYQFNRDSTAASSGSYIVVPAAGPGRWQAVSTPNGVFNVKTFGATGDGVTDDTAAIQAAIDACEAVGGGIVYFPAGTYAISEQLTVTEAIQLIGEGWGDSTTSASQPTEPVTALLWIGVNSGTDAMVLFKAANANEYIYDCGIDQIAIKGNNAAYDGVRMSSTRRSVIGSLWVERVRHTGLLYDDNNGVLSAQNSFEDYHYQVGSNAATSASNGLVARSDAGVGCTGLEGSSVVVTTKDGNGVELCDIDNSYIGKIVGVVSGAGYGLYFRGLTDGQTRVARKNFVFMFGNGPVFAETRSNNAIQWINSESTSVTFESANTVLDYRVLDRQDGRRWNTFQYKVNDYKTLELANGYAVVGTPVLATTGGNLGRGVAFDAAADESWMWTVPPDRSWSGGKLLGAIVRGQKSGTAGTGDVVFQLSALQRTDANALGGGTLLSENFTVTVDADTIQTLQKFEFTFATAKDVGAESHLLFRVSRLGTNIGDTYGSDFIVSSVQLFYLADVANSDSPGNYRYQAPADVLT